MDDYLEANRRLWDAWTPLNVASEFYDVESFKAGRVDRPSMLHELEAGLVGDVTGRTLLHLQCHFGMDTIRWARRGARATGIDFSSAAIEAARRLAAEMRVAATFVESDVYALPDRLDHRFDVVFTSHGALCWLPDLVRWAEVIAHFLAPGGVFCIVEAHPVGMIFDETRTDGELRVRFPYFQGPEPIRDEHPGSYAAPDAPLQSVEHVWIHPIGEIVGSLLRAGLRLESFAEYPFMAWRALPWMEQRPDGAWQLPGAAATLPLMFSLTARKPA